MKSADLRSKLVDHGPREVMANRSQIDWDRNYAYTPTEDENIDFLAQLIDQLYILLPSMRDLRKMALLEDERLSGGPRLTAEVADQVMADAVEEHDVSPSKTVPGMAYTVISDAVSSILGYAACAWKVPGYWAEETHIVEVLEPTSEFKKSCQVSSDAEEIRISMLAMAYSNHKSTKPKVSWYLRCEDQQRRKLCSVATRKLKRVAALPPSERQAKVERSRCELDHNKRTRLPSPRAEEMLGAGAACLIVTRMLLSRKKLVFSI